MNGKLRRMAIVVGLFLLGLSAMWSQDGFNFDLAGDSGGTNVAIIAGWGLAVSVTVVQFVFSTNYNKLNPSLITFGIIAYAYSIYTNKLGISHFQGGSANNIGAWILAFVMDGVPEPLIAWGLGESLSGDFIGNILTMLGVQEKQENTSSKNTYKPQHKPMHSHQPYPKPNSSNPTLSQRPPVHNEAMRQFLEQQGEKNANNNRNNGGFATVRNRSDDKRNGK